MESLTNNKTFVNSQLAILLKGEVKEFGKVVNNKPNFNNLSIQNQTSQSASKRKKLRGVLNVMLRILKTAFIFILKVFYYVLLFSFYVLFYVFKFWFFMLKILLFPIFLLCAFFFDTPKKKGFKKGEKCAKGKRHYGYRYGRWYYGHNHVEGCEFNDSTCSGGND